MLKDKDITDWNRIMSNVENKNTGTVLKCLMKDIVKSTSSNDINVKELVEKMQILRKLILEDKTQDSLKEYAQVGHLKKISADGNLFGDFQ